MLVISLVYLKIYFFKIHFARGNGLITLTLSQIPMLQKCGYWVIKILEATSYLLTVYFKQRQRNYKEINSSLNIELVSLYLLSYKVNIQQSCQTSILQLIRIFRCQPLLCGVSVKNASFVRVDLPGTGPFQRPGRDPSTVSRGHMFMLNLQE